VIGATATHRRPAYPILPAYVGLGFGFTLLVVVWAMFMMPVALGGRTSFIVVNGASMQPALQDGDLTVLHRSSGYEPGEVVAFRANGGIAIHRIQSVEPDGSYVLKGDNKERVDPWLPRDENILGRVVLRVPLAGGMMQNGGPLQFGMLVGLLVTIAVFWPGAGESPRAVVRPAVDSPRPRRQRPAPGAAPAKDDDGAAAA
jgi:signal peptidase